MKESYGQFVIKYDENCDRFIGMIGELRIASAEKLSSLKKALDKHGESEKSFKRVKVFKHEPWEGWIFGEVTSVAVDGKPWCSWTDKKGKKSRGKPWATEDLFLDIPENAEIRNKINTLDADLKALKEQRDQLCEEMAKFKVTP